MDDGQTDKIILFYFYVLNQQVEDENRSLIRDFNQLFREFHGRRTEYLRPSIVGHVMETILQLYFFIS